MLSQLKKILLKLKYLKKILIRVLSHYKIIIWMELFLIIHAKLLLAIYTMQKEWIIILGSSKAFMTIIYIIKDLKFLFIATLANFFQLINLIIQVVNKIFVVI